MKRIKQIEESKSMVGMALLQLLQDNELNDISISRICDEARVSRMTFYRNFETKEDIVLYILQSFFQNLQQGMLDIPSPSLRDLVYLQFKMLKEKSSIVIILSRIDTRNILNDFRKAHLSRFGELIEYTDSYTREFNLGGIDYLSARWIESGMKESPLNMTEIVMKQIGRK